MKVKKKIRKVDVLRKISKHQRLQASISKALANNDPDKENIDFKDMMSLSDTPPDTQYFLDMFPDLVAAADIMVTATLFPKDFATMDINYSLGESQIPSNILFDIVQEAATILEDDFNIKDVLQEAAKHELIGDGGIVKIILPEGVIDKLMFNSRVTMESINNLFSSDDYGYNYLGKEDSSFTAETTEDTSILNYIEVTDNIDILRLPEIEKAVQTTESMASSYGHVMKEKPLSDDQVLHLSNSYRKRQDVDKPLVISMHPRACKNIYPPGEPQNPVAHIILLNENGYPITKPPKYVSPEKRMKLFAKSGLKRNTIVTRAKSNIKRATDDKKENRDDEVTIFDKYISGLIKSRMNNGMFNINEDLDLDVIAQTTFARAMERKKTRVLVLPASMVTYFAMDYDDNGVAINKISRLSVLCSMRGLLLFSAMGNSVANNSEHLKVTVNLDEDTSDVDKVMKKAKRAVMNMNEAKLPVGISNPRDFIEWQQRTGVTFAFKGHPDLPKTEISFDHETRDRNTETDTALLEHIRTQLLLAIGPGPEIVDNGFDNNTATETEANKILFAKKGEQLKRPLLQQGSAFSSRILLAHGEFFRNCEKTLLADDTTYELFLEETKSSEMIIVNDDDDESDTKPKLEEPEDKLPDNMSRDGDAFKYFVNRAIFDLLRTFKIDIPDQAVSNKASDLNDELEAFKSWLDTALPAWLSEDMLDRSNVGDNISEELRVLVEAYKSYFVREFLAENRMLVDLDQIIKQDKLGKPTLNIASRIGDHNTRITDNIKEVLELFNIKAKETDEEIEKRKAKEAEEEEKAAAEAAKKGEPPVVKEPTQSPAPVEDPPEEDDFNL